MQIYSETVFQHINSVVDFVGYSLMLALALIIWWGISSDTKINVTQGNSQVSLDDNALTESSTKTLSTLPRSSDSWRDADIGIDVSWASSAGR